VVEDPAALAEPLSHEPAAEVHFRSLGPPEPDMLHRAAEVDVTVCANPIVACGRVELTRWLREKVISRNLHRYENLL